MSKAERLDRRVLQALLRDAGWEVRSGAGILARRRIDDAAGDVYVRCTLRPSQQMVSLDPWMRSDALTGAARRIGGPKLDPVLAEGRGALINLADDGAAGFREVLESVLDWAEGIDLEGALGDCTAEAPAGREGEVVRLAALALLGDARAIRELRAGAEDPAEAGVEAAAYDIALEIAAEHRPEAEIVSLAAWRKGRGG